MSTPIEDYALIGDCETVALVSKTGSIGFASLDLIPEPLLDTRCDIYNLCPDSLRLYSGGAEVAQMAD
jgi:hypothetical protein